MQFSGRVEKSFLYSKRSISDARKKARDLWDVWTSEGRKKGKKVQRFAMRRLRCPSSSSVSLPFRSEKIHEVEGKKEIILVEFPSFPVERNNTFLLLYNHRSCTASRR